MKKWTFEAHAIQSKDGKVYLCSVREKPGETRRVAEAAMFMPWKSIYGQGYRCIPITVHVEDRYAK